MLAALAFGSSAPLAKTLVGEMPRMTLSMLWYVGAGLGLVVISLVRPHGKEVPLGRADIPRLLVVSVTGGLAPFLQIVGLQHVSGVTGALLLGLELPFTALVAVLAFREKLKLREIAGIAVIFAGGALLGIGDPGAGENATIGVLATVAACGVWAVDSNLTQRLAGRDPLAVARIKTLSAAFLVSLVFMVANLPLPDDRVLIAKGLLVGFLSYGVSEVLFIAAMRHLGATRTGGVFATASFLGAFVAIPLLRVVPSFLAWSAGAVMATGVFLMLSGAQLERRVQDPGRARPETP